MRKITLISFLSIIYISVFCQTTHNKSSFHTDTIHSKFLSEDRVINIYLPKNFSLNKQYSVVYATDGDMLDNNYASKLDSLIDKKIIKETVVIGVYANEKKIKESWYYRHFEYIKSWYDDSQNEFNDTLLKNRFSNHMKFFLNEVIPYAEKKYNASQDPNQRTFYGFSNGGGFGITLSKLDTFLFKNYFLFSPLGDDFNNVKWKKNTQPNIFISYGINEPEPFLINFHALETKLKKKRYKFSSTPFNGGHDRKLWEKEFFNKLIEINK